MNSGILNLFAWGVLLLLPVLTREVHGEEKTTRPHIIFLLTDDQSTDSLGCYGNPDVKTPNLDRLAAEGMVFDRHYTTTAICMASRATVMTGLYEYRTGCNFTHGDLKRETWKQSYPVLLRQAGYRTAFAGKFGFEVEGVGLCEKDFDRWGGGPGQTHYETAKNPSMRAYAEEFPHSTLAYGAFGRDFIRESASSGKPFCLSISFKAPHRPTTPDPRFRDLYAGKSFRKPANFGREHGEHFSKQSRQGRQYPRFHSWGYADRFDEVMAIYHRQIHAIDVAVGMVREALREKGVEKQTVIIFTSDNGFFCGSHGYGSKVLPYEESSRVPLIIFDPRHENSGKKLRSGALTGNIDFAPTILGLAGVPVPEGLDGKDLMRLYDDPEASIHGSLALINVWGPAPTHALSVVTRDWKYIHWGHAAEGFEVTEELYHLARDPLELKELSNRPEHREDLLRLRAIYDRHLAHWKARAVPYHDYRRFGVLFDREVPWTEKKRQLGRRR